MATQPTQFILFKTASDFQLLHDPPSVFTGQRALLVLTQTMDQYLLQHLYESNRKRVRFRGREAHGCCRCF